MNRTTTAMYEAGFAHGYDQAVRCCFGGSNKVWPFFSTPEEANEYDEGYEDGFNSVDD